MAENVPADQKSNKKARPGSRSFPDPPPDWRCEERPRESGKYQGRTDKFYYDPVTNKQFRSSRTVWEHLRKKMENFDFETPPQKVTWTLDDPDTNEWSPQVEDAEVSDFEKRLWQDTFQFVAHWDTKASASASTSSKEK